MGCFASPFLKRGLKQPILATHLGVGGLLPSLSADVRSADGVIPFEGRLPVVSVTLGTIQGYYMGEVNPVGEPEGWGVWGALNTPSTHQWPGTGYIGQWKGTARHGVGYGWW